MNNQNQTWSAGMTPSEFADARETFDTYCILLSRLAVQNNWCEVDDDGRPLMTYIRTTCNAAGCNGLVNGIPAPVAKHASRLVMCPAHAHRGGTVLVRGVPYSPACAVVVRALQKAVAPHTATDDDVKSILGDTRDALDSIHERRRRNGYLP